MLNVYQFVLNLEMVILQVNYSQLERFFHETIGTYWPDFPTDRNDFTIINFHHRIGFIQTNKENDVFMKALPW